jgi:hypothetical protein
MRFEVLKAVMLCGLVGRNHCFSEMLVSTYKSTQRYHPANQHRQYSLSCLV